MTKLAISKPKISEKVLKIEKTDTIFGIRARPILSATSTTHASLGLNCEAAHPACRKRCLLGTHQWQSALLVMMLPVSNLHL